MIHNDAKEYEVDILEASRAACLSNCAEQPQLRSGCGAQELEELMGTKIADRENLKPEEKARDIRRLIKLRKSQTNRLMTDL